MTNPVPIALKSEISREKQRRTAGHGHKPLPSLPDHCYRGKELLFPLGIAMWIPSPTHTCRGSELGSARAESTNGSTMNGPFPGGRFPLSRGRRARDAIRATRPARGKARGRLWGSASPDFNLKESARCTPVLMLRKSVIL